MPRPTVEFLNARKELRKGSDHSSKRKVTYCPDSELHPLDLGIESARSAISSFAIWAEASRQVLIEKLGIPQSTGFDLEATF